MSSVETEAAAGCYTTKTIHIKPENLLLDPGNPRLVSSHLEQGAYEEEDFLDSRLQRQLVEKLKAQSNITQLIRKIETNGFTPGVGNQMLVKHLKDNKYLVLEGNRRTAALRQLLERKKTLPKNVQTSIETIEVSEFTYRANSPLSEKSVIDILLYQTHVDGVLGWGAMEKATYMRRVYERAYLATFQGQRVLYMEQIAQQICDQYSIEDKELKRVLCISGIFAQLKQIEPEIKSDIFTLLDLAVTTKSVRKKVFGLNAYGFVFNEQGLTRFLGLCYGPTRIIHNPQTFKRFVLMCQGIRKISDNKLTVFAVENSTINELMEGEITLEEAELRAKVFDQHTVFNRKIKKLSDDLEKLPIGQFKNSTENVQQVDDFIDLVMKLLVPFSSKYE